MPAANIDGRKTKTRPSRSAIVHSIAAVGDEVRLLGLDVTLVQAPTSLILTAAYIRKAAGKLESLAVQLQECEAV